MKIIDRLRVAWVILTGESEEEEEEADDPYHRYGIVIGESCYLADSYSIDPYSGDPEWDYAGFDGRIHCKKYDGWILKEYR